MNLQRLFEWFPGLKNLFVAKSSADFDSVLEAHFASCVQRMEAEAHHLAADSEEKLSAFLAASLSMPGLSVEREAYSNGRVDLTIRTEGSLLSERRLAEAKIYKSYSYHVQAIEQLVARYSTGRQPTGYVIEYVKKPDISNIVLNLRNKSDRELPVNQDGATSDHSMRWTYESRHTHKSGELMRVVHINVNISR